MNTTMINGFVVPKPIKHLDDQLEEVYVYTIDPYVKDGYSYWLIDDSPDCESLFALINGAAYDSEEKVKAVVSAMRGIDPEWGE